MKTLVYGGSSSGKSSFAESVICEKQAECRIYLATMDRNSGGDSTERIARHEKMRSGKGFSTVESVEKNADSFFCDIIRQIEEKTAENDCPILLEDVGNLVARVVFSDFPLVHIHKNDAFFAEKTIAFIERLFSLSSDIVFVSNDIFLEKLDLEDDGMRAYFSTLSRINIYLSQRCDEVFRVVVGISVREK